MGSRFYREESVDIRRGRVIGFGNKLWGNLGGRKRVEKKEEKRNGK